MNEKFFFAAGSLSGFFAVAAGAFGAHALKNKLSPDMLTIFETGVKYQMYHALALLAAAWAIGFFHPGMARSAGWFFLFGSIIFSGSLYLLVFTGVRMWGAVTPLGGLSLLAGWFMLALSAIKKG